MLPAITGVSASVLALGANSNSGNSGDTDLNSIGTDDLSNLINALDYSYASQQENCYSVFNQNTFNKLRSQKDKYGRLLWTAGLSDSAQPTILGYKYQIDNAMPSIGAGNIPIVFGAFNDFVIRDVLGMTLVRYNELYMPNHQIGYEAFLCTDCKVLQPAAFAYLIHPQS